MRCKSMELISTFQVLARASQRGVCGEVGHSVRPVSVQLQELHFMGPKEVKAVWDLYFHKTLRLLVAFLFPKRDELPRPKLDST